MNKNYPLSKIQELLGPSQNILVLMPKRPSFDHVAAGLSLFLALGKAGKKVTVASPEKMIVEFSHLVGLDQVKTGLAENDLMITIKSPLENIEKVFTTNEQSGNLQVVIRSKPGKEVVKSEDLIFSSQGSLPDLIFTIGARKPEEFGDFYQTKKEMFDKTRIVNLDNHPQNASFGAANVVDHQAACLSEMMVFLISGLNLPIDPDIGGNLVLGLRKATDNFQQRQVTAATFEAAAIAMRFRGEPVLSQKPQEEVIPSPEETPPTSSNEPPAEWLEPKIYKGSTLP